MHSPFTITPEQIAAYHADGFVPLHDVLAPDEIARLRQRADDIADGVVPYPERLMQLEPVAVNNASIARHLRVRKIVSLTLHDPVFAQLLRHPNVVKVATSMLGPDVKLLLDQMLCKPPHIGSAKPYHQDGPYWPIEPMDHCTLWIALDDSTRDNGCMRFLPGTHKLGPLAHDATLGHHRMPQGWESLSQRPDEVFVEASAGSGSCHHGLVLHETSDNRSPFRRRAMTMAFMKATARWTSDAPKPTFMSIAGRSFEGCI